MKWVRWGIVALGLVGCPREPAEAPKPAPTKSSAPQAKAPKVESVPAKDVKPPMIDREHVVRVERVEQPDGSGVWMTRGAPIVATGHYVGDAPRDAKSGTYEMTFVEASDGDYPHLVFQLGEDRYDFGWGDNQLAGSGFDIEDKAPLVGKSFRVRWAYRPTTFMCCDGDTASWVGMKPTILDIRSAVELP